MNIEIVFPILVILIAAIPLVSARAAMKRRALIRNLETSAIGQGPTGFVELKGEIRAIGPLTSPYSQAECVYYTYAVQRYYHHSKGGGHWRTVQSGSDSCPFLLTDGSGAARIDPSGAQIDLRVDTRARTGLFSNDEEINAFLQRVGVSTSWWFGFQSVRVVESYLAPGDALYVLGTARPGEDRGPTGANIDLGGRGERDLFLSDASEEALLSRLLWKAIGLGLLAALFLGIGVAMLLVPNIHTR